MSVLELFIVTNKGNTLVPFLCSTLKRKGRTAVVAFIQNVLVENKVSPTGYAWTIFHS